MNRENNLSQNNKIKFNVFRIIAFLVIYGIFGVLLFSYLRSYVCIIFMLVFIVIPVSSIVMLLRMKNKISFKLMIGEQEINCHDVIAGSIKVQNDSIFTLLHCKCNLELNNIFFDEFDELEYIIPVVAKSTDTHPILINANQCGLIQLSLTECEMKDLCGLVRYSVEVGYTCEVVVFPGKRDINEEDRLSILEGYSDNEDTTAKGNEFSDVSDIREYIPGDRIKDIHWKLSAKKDILLIKDRVKMSENKLVIWLDSSMDKRECENVLSYTISIIEDSLREGVAAKLFWYNYHYKNIEEIFVTTTNNVKDFVKLFFMSGSGKTIETPENLLIQNGIVSSFIRVGYFESQIGLRVYE